MKCSVLVLGVAMLLSACGSAVRLDNPPVEDRSSQSGANNAAASAKAAAGANGTGVSTGSVVPVELSPRSGDGAEQGAARVVYFDYDSYSIRAEFQPLIEANARLLTANPKRTVTLQGHTDSRGGREYNLALGQKRAEAVRRALSLLGVRDNQMEAVSFGKEKPAVAGDTEDAMEKNRRVEISYQ